MAVTLGSRALWIGVAGVATICGLAAVTLVLMEPARATVRHNSPDRRYAVILTSDTNFGQVERLRVLANPDSLDAKLLLDHAGEAPLQFLGWRDDVTAVLEAAPHNGHEARRLLLQCDGLSCRLELTPGP